MPTGRAAPRRRRASTVSIASQPPNDNLDGTQHDTLLVTELIHEHAHPKHPRRRSSAATTDISSSSIGSRLPARRRSLCMRLTEDMIETALDAPLSLLDRCRVSVGHRMACRAVSTALDTRPSSEGGPWPIGPQLESAGRQAVVRGLVEGLCELALRVDVSAVAGTGRSAAMATELRVRRSAYDQGLASLAGTDGEAVRNTEKLFASRMLLRWANRQRQRSAAATGAFPLAGSRKSNRGVIAAERRAGADDATFAARLVQQWVRAKLDDLRRDASLSGPRRRPSSPADNADGDESWLFASGSGLSSAAEGLPHTKRADGDDFSDDGADSEDYSRYTGEAALLLAEEDQREWELEQRQSYVADALALHGQRTPLFASEFEARAFLETIVALSRTERADRSDMEIIYASFVRSVTAHLTDVRHHVERLDRSQRCLADLEAKGRTSIDREWSHYVGTAYCVRWGIEYGAESAFTYREVCVVVQDAEAASREAIEMESELDLRRVAGTRPRLGRLLHRVQSAGTSTPQQKCSRPPTPGVSRSRIRMQRALEVEPEDLRLQRAAAAGRAPSSRPGTAVRSPQASEGRSPLRSEDSDAGPPSTPQLPPSRSLAAELESLVLGLHSATGDGGQPGFGSDAPPPILPPRAASAGFSVASGRSGHYTQSAVSLMGSEVRHQAHKRHWSRAEAIRKEDAVLQHVLSASRVLQDTTHHDRVAALRERHRKSREEYLQEQQERHRANREQALIESQARRQLAELRNTRDPEIRRELTASLATLQTITRTDPTRHGHDRSRKYIGVDRPTSSGAGLTPMRRPDTGLVPPRREVYNTAGVYRPGSAARSTVGTTTTAGGSGTSVRSATSHRSSSSPLPPSLPPAGPQTSAAARTSEHSGQQPLLHAVDARLVDVLERLQDVVVDFDAVAKRARSPLPAPSDTYHERTENPSTRGEPHRPEEESEENPAEENEHLGTDEGSHDPFDSRTDASMDPPPMKATDSHRMLPREFRFTEHGRVVKASIDALFVRPPLELDPAGRIVRWALDAQHLADTGEFAAANRLLHTLRQELQAYKERAGRARGQQGASTNLDDDESSIPRLEVAAAGSEAHVCRAEGRLVDAARHLQRRMEAERRIAVAPTKKSKPLPSLPPPPLLVAPETGVWVDTLLSVSAVLTGINEAPEALQYARAAVRTLTAATLALTRDIRKASSSIGTSEQTATTTTLEELNLLHRDVAFLVKTAALALHNVAMAQLACPATSSTTLSSGATLTTLPALAAEQRAARTTYRACVAVAESATVEPEAVVARLRRSAAHFAAQRRSSPPLVAPTEGSPGRAQSDPGEREPSADAPRSREPNAEAVAPQEEDDG